MTDQTTTTTETGRRFNTRVVAVAVAAAVIVLFVVQNTDDVPVRFLWMEGNFPLFLLLLITVAMTLVLALGATWFVRRRSDS